MSSSVDKFILGDATEKPGILKDVEFYIEQQDRKITWECIFDNSEPTRWEEFQKDCHPECKVRYGYREKGTLACVINLCSVNAQLVVNP